jgi:hypothetical protein
LIAREDGAPKNGAPYVRLALTGAILLMASAAAAQPPAQSPPAPAFLPHAAFEFQWAGLVANDPRFDWHGVIGFDVDVVEYGIGRATFGGEYEAVLGHERRSYDLNHGNYRFEATGSYRLGRLELALLTVHISRHLSDREQPGAVSWNVIGVRANRRFAPERSTVDAEVSFGFAGQQAFVDYDWMSEARVVWRRPISERWSFMSIGTGLLVGVDEEVAGRPNLCGGRIEGGVRVAGSRAALELFAGYERRVDAFPTDRFRVRMFTAGFRIVSR